MGVVVNATEWAVCWCKCESIPSVIIFLCTSELHIFCPRQLAGVENIFVEEPSDDFFCPVTTGLLLQPHLTSCCGNHISQEAATKINREEGPCPLCKTSSWSTVLNKHFQRQVYSLRVFCCHEDKGCGWKGELSTFDNHVRSCPMKDSPLINELLKP